MRRFSGPRLRLPSSIRFRLTAWYTLLLAGVLAVLGFSVLRLTDERLQMEGEARLKKTGEDIVAAVEKLGPGLQIEEVDGQPFSLESVGGLTSSLQGFAKRGLLIQVANANEEVRAHSPYAPTEEVLLPVDPARKTKFASGVARVDGVEVRAIRLPIIANGRFPIGAIYVGERLDGQYATLAALRRTLFVTSLVGLALAVAGGWLLAGRALRPVARVTATAAQIAAGDGVAASLATRLRVPDSGDEIAHLAATFNAMLDRLEASFRSQQRFVADASHELRTPLTAIRGNVEVLARQLGAMLADVETKDDLDAAIADIQRESARMGRLVDDLLFLVRTDAPDPGAPRFEPRPLRLDEVARDAGRTASALANGQHLQVVAATPVTVRGDADRLEQLLLILLDNALRHTPAGKRVVVEVIPARSGMTAVAVRDEGEGIAPEHLPHLFDRFYRADDARGRVTGGTGLGLAIARAIAHAHGGEIGVRSESGVGSVFTVSLPAEASVVSPEAAKRLPAA